MEKCGKVVTKEYGHNFWRPWNWLGHLQDKINFCIIEPVY